MNVNGSFRFILVFMLLGTTVRGMLSNSENVSGASPARLTTDDGIVRPATPSALKCNHKIIGQFFKVHKKIDFEAVESSRNIQRICPNLHQTCCGREEITYFLKHYKTGLKDMQKIRRLHEFIYMNLKINSAANIKENLVAYKTEKNKSCMGEEAFGRLEEDVDYIESELEKANIYFTFFYNFYLKFYAGVGCELCNPFAHEFIQESDKRPKGVKIEIDQTSVSEILKIGGLVIHYQLFLVHIVDLLSLIACRNRGVNPYKNLLSMESVRQRLNFNRGCQAKYKRQMTFGADDECLELLSLFRSLLRPKDVVEISQVLDLAFGNLINTLSTSLPNDKQAEYFEQAVTPEFYEENDEVFYLDFTNVEYQITNKRGFNAIENQFERSFIRETARLLVLKAVLTLLAIWVG